ncbi:MAG TPA: FecR domain-containing protein [Cyclobacteriaceae bacterium]|nr:FecR domain-containing protein [Cyclobacteriaceae bacterium]
MDISNWTVEDFVIDETFVDWVISPRPDNQRYWQGLLERHPHQRKSAEQAREILLRMERQPTSLELKDKTLLWQGIKKKIVDEAADQRLIGYNSRVDTIKTARYRLSQFHKVAAILLVASGLSLVVNLTKEHQDVSMPPAPVEYAEHKVPAGAKASITLADGSKVLLNSESILRYKKNFEPNRRALYLEGEALFEVQKDSMKPFIVYSGSLATMAIGTSFNIHAYEPEAVKIYLLAGKALVTDSLHQEAQMFLEIGEAASKNSQGIIQKSSFDEEEVTAWTKGIIILDKTPIYSAIQTLEKWYGVSFHLRNEPPEGLTVSGKFENEQLKNILDGLSYSARFVFDIEGKQVFIRFIKP